MNLNNFLILFFGNTCTLKMWVDANVGRTMPISQSCVLKFVRKLFKPRSTVVCILKYERKNSFSVRKYSFDEI